MICIKRYPRARYCTHCLLPSVCKKNMGELQAKWLVRSRRSLMVICIEILGYYTIYTDHSSRARHLSDKRGAIVILFVKQAKFLFFIHFAYSEGKNIRLAYFAGRRKSFPLNSSENKSTRAGSITLPFSLIFAMLL